MKLVLFEAPTAKLIAPPLTVTNGSLTVTLVNGTFPVLVTTKLYVMVSPTFVTPIGAVESTYVPSFVIAIDGL